MLFDGATKQGVVIDPGGDVDKITQTLRQNSIAVEAVWLTHGHLDHAGGAAELRDALGVPVIGPHKDDLPLLETIEEQGRGYNIFGLRNVVPDHFLEEGETVSFSDCVFDVLHCPGHAPGHVIYVDRAREFAHLGDVLFRGSIGRTDLPGGDEAALLASIRDKVLPLGDDFKFICGHGPGGTIAEERRSNPFIQGLD